MVASAGYFHTAIMQRRGRHDAVAGSQWRAGRHLGNAPGKLVAGVSAESDQLARIAATNNPNGASRPVSACTANAGSKHVQRPLRHRLRHHHLDSIRRLCFGVLAQHPAGSTLLGIGGISHSLRPAAAREQAVVLRRCSPDTNTTAFCFPTRICVAAARYCARAVATSSSRLSAIIELSD